MTQKRRQGRYGNAIREMAALRWEPTHVTKHCPRVVPLHPPSRITSSQYQHTLFQVIK